MTSPVAVRARGRVTKVGAWINGLAYLPKWLVLASVIGVIAGLGAIVFYETLDAATHLFLGVLAGYHVPKPAGEGGGGGSAHFSRPWAIPAVIVGGALLSGALVFTFAPEAEGHGTDAAIDAVHHNPRGIRLRAVLIKLIASALTIGSGGSGGREGPTAQISAGFGSLLARVLDLSPEDGRIAVSVGVGSGIGAIFSAPLGGAVLAGDIVYREDFEYSALLPGALASIVAYAIFGAAFGYQPLFAIPGGYHFEHPVQLLWFAVIGLLAGGLGLLYSRSFYGTVRLAHRLPIPRQLRPAVGGLIVGAMALGLPEVIGTGYGWVQKDLSGQLDHTSILIILALPLARILATSLSIGTGGSGGVFGPGMVIGAFTGLAVWRVLEPWAPSVGHDPAPYVIVAMMAVFGGISRAPIAVMLMVAQMTGSISLLGPALVAVAIAWFIVGRADDSIYRSQLRSREDSAAYRLQLGLPLLATLRSGDIAVAARLVLQDRVTVAAASEQLAASGVPGAPVVDSDGTYLGTVDAALLEQAEPDALLASTVDATTMTAQASASVDTALQALTRAGGRWVTVTDRERKVVGILAIGDIMRTYQEAVDHTSDRLAEVSGHALVVEDRIGTTSALCGVRLGDAALPAGTVIVAIERERKAVAVHSGTRLEADDIVTAFAAPEHASHVRDLICGGPPEPDGVREGAQMI